MGFQFRRRVGRRRLGPAGSTWLSDIACLWIGYPAGRGSFLRLPWKRQ